MSRYYVILTFLNLHSANGSLEQPHPSPYVTGGALLIIMDRQFFRSFLCHNVGCRIIISEIFGNAVKAILTVSSKRFCPVIEKR
ncbi:hypothetical protein TNIN_362461 [Trichonephila inaurata madagascariensis]|uniref:Uncharacterized protein n=1 Tax=Trichonephila inaurata madagascariensis TaxID=2747483 RepID=A0A8X6YJK2_9ARAC|nr:hypothetical protein TNIN_362461 [Trichonephila inaurata madagascariensis]